MRGKQKEEMTAKANQYFYVNGEWLHYAALHSRLRRANGKAWKCEQCKTVGLSRYEWALINGRQYSLNILDYIQLCVSCHKKYDDTIERRTKISNWRRGRFVGANNPASKKVIDFAKNIIYPTVSEAAYRNGLKRTTLVMMLCGKNKNKTTLKYL